MFFTSAALIFTHFVQAQNTFPPSGNVGIGTTAPIVGLHVNGTSIIGNYAGSSYDENLRLPSSAVGYACIALGAIPGPSGIAPGDVVFN